MATSTPEHLSSAAASPADAPPLFALGAQPLIALTQDEKLLALLKRVTDPAHALRAAGSEIDFSALLMQTQAGVAVLDCAAVATPIEMLTARLRAQFPELVLVVAGTAAEQGALSAQIADGTVHRFLHKPLSEQRVRLFVDAAWRRREEARPVLPMAGATRRPPGRHRRPWLLGGLLLGLGAGLTWYLNYDLSPDAGPAVPVSPAAHPIPADTELETLLQRAERAFAAGALVTPPTENAADLYRQAQLRNAHDPRVLAGVEQLIERLLADAEAQLQERQLDAAQQLVDQARTLQADHPRVAFIAAQIGAQRERAVLGKAQRAAAGGDVTAALAVLDEATRGGHRSTLVDEARTQLAQKQIEARVGDFLARARGAAESGALLGPPEQNARFYVESALALAPNDAAVLNARSELSARMKAQAQLSLGAGEAEQADNFANAAADLGAAADEVAALHGAADKLRGRTHADALTHLQGLFVERLTQGRLLEPANDNARYYLEQLAQAEPAGAATLSARSAFEERLLEEARAALRAQDYPLARHWLAEARANGASASALGALETQLQAAPSGLAPAAPQTSDTVNASNLTRTRYVAPSYPPAAQVRGLEGWVDVQFAVKSDGTVGDVAIVGAQPVGIFETAAVDAVRRWRYQPVRRDGQLITQQARIRVRFAVQR